MGNISLVCWNVCNDTIAQPTEETNITGKFCILNAMIANIADIIIAIIRPSVMFLCP